MLNAKEVKQINHAIAKVTKCDGDCKGCAQFFIETAGWFYAFSCSVAKDAGYQIMSDSVYGLRDETLEGLKFELT